MQPMVIAGIDFTPCTPESREIVPGCLVRSKAEGTLMIALAVRGDEVIAFWPHGTKAFPVEDLEFMASPESE